MKKRTLITILGIIVALLPITHFPGSWKNPAYIILGLTITYLAIPLKKIILVKDVIENVPTVAVSEARPPRQKKSPRANAITTAKEEIKPEEYKADVVLEEMSETERG